MRQTGTPESKASAHSLQPSVPLFHFYPTNAGVGELSAINGVAGAYSERVPVVHIVGCPSTKLQHQGALLHHTLGNGDFTVFKDISKALSKSQAYLDDVATAPGEIDRVLRDAYLSARPVYLMMPTDMVMKEVPGIFL
jgi:pyruvate decarboxylase